MMAIADEQWQTAAKNMMVYDPKTPGCTIAIGSWKLGYTLKVNGDRESKGSLQTSLWPSDYILLSVQCHPGKHHLAEEQY
jgi:hypothetical protein